MESDNRQRHLIILIGVGIAAIAAFGWLIPKLLTVPFSGSLPTPGSSGTPANNLPKDLRVVSGRITDISGSSMTIEWSVPQERNFDNPSSSVPKHVTWTRGTVFDALGVGPTATPRTIAIKDLKVGQMVTVTTVETVQDHFELKALHVRVELVPAQ